MDDDDAARRDVYALPRLAEQHRQRAAQRDEDLLLVRVEVAATARVRGIAPHPRPRLGHARGLGERGCQARFLTLVARSFLPLEIGMVHDVPVHSATIPSARMAEPRPAALPPAERTIGQLVAESIQFYGHRFWACLALGVAPAAVAVLFTNVSREYQLILAPTLSGALVSATFVWASTLVLDSVPLRRRLVAAWQLARADFVHAAGSLFTLAVVVLLSQSVLVFTLRGFGDADVSTALFLASVVLSPLLFVGTALLYVDQEARVE